MWCFLLVFPPFYKQWGLLQLLNLRHVACFDILRSAVIDESPEEGEEGDKPERDSNISKKSEDIVRADSLHITRSPILLSYNWVSKIDDVNYGEKTEIILLSIQCLE